MPPKGEWLFGLLFGYLHRKGLLSVKIEQVKVEEVILFLNTLEFKADLVDLQFLIFCQNELIGDFPGG